MDPLNLLREWTIEGKLDSIKLGTDRVEFASSYSFKRDVPTAYKSQKGKGDFYPLAALLVFLRNKATPFPQYVKITKEERVPAVSYLDRKDVEAYLTGASSSSDYIQLIAPELNFSALPQQQDAQPDTDAEPAAKRARLGTAAAPRRVQASAADAAAPGAGDSFMQQVEKHERRLWHRNSVLTVPGKSFLRASQLAQTAQQELARSDPSKRYSTTPYVPQKSHGRVAIPVKPSNRFERSTGVDTTVQDMGFNDIKLQTYGAAAQQPSATANGSAAAALPAAAAAAPPPPLSAEKPSVPRSASKPQSERRRSSQTSSRPSSSGRPQADPNKGAAPIIIVPKGYETKLNMFNAHVFLEEGRFQTWQECQEAGVKKAGSRTFHRTIGRSKPVPYQVTDSAPARNDHKTWRRVVAVFVQGKEWQFKEWPFKGAAQGDMVDTLNRMLGVHLVAANEQPPPLVKQWNVKILKLHPNDRHGDMQLARDFYGYLDALLGARKSQLAY